MAVLDEAKRISSGTHQIGDTSAAAGAIKGKDKQLALTSLHINQALKRVLPSNGEPGGVRLRPYLPVAVKQSWHLDKQSLRAVKQSWKKQKLATDTAAMQVKEASATAAAGPDAER